MNNYSFGPKLCSRNLATGIRDNWGFPAISLHASQNDSKMPQIL